MTESSSNVRNQSVCHDLILSLSSSTTAFSTLPFPPALNWIPACWRKSKIRTCVMRKIARHVACHQRSDARTLSVPLTGGTRMGLLGKFLGTQPAKKPTDDVLLLHSILCMAGADGAIEDTEDEMIRNFANTLPEFRDMDGDEFDKCLERAEDRPQVQPRHEVVAAGARRDPERRRAQEGVRAGGRHRDVVGRRRRGRGRDARGDAAHPAHRRRAGQRVVEIIALKYAK